MAALIFAAARLAAQGPAEAGAPPAASATSTTTRQDSSRRIPRGARATTAAMLGMVTTLDGRPAGGVLVRLTHASGKQASATTAADGIFRIPGLAPGAYSLSVSRTGLEELLQKQVTLFAGEVVAVEVQLREAAVGAAARSRGIAAAAGGEPQEGEPSFREISRRWFDLEETQYGDLLAAEKDVFLPRARRWEAEIPRPERFPGRDGEYPQVYGRWWDPFNRNKVKGDYPIFGNSVFFGFTGVSTTAVDVRRAYVPSGVSTAEPGREEFFGSGAQQFLSQTFRLSFDLFRGNTAFRPLDWRVRVTPAINLNQLWTRQRGVVNIDVRRGTGRTDHHVGLQEAFLEVKLRDLSHHYDFVSLRAGIQQFNSDFRGLVFASEQPGVRLFGNLFSNRLEYNAAYFFLLEKDTNSGLNTLDQRHQQVMVANLYVQDFLTRGYTAQVSYHYNKDDASLHYDENGFLVRPAPVGAVTPHDIRAHYVGWTGNGHIGRYNLNHAFYQVLGYDELNPVAGRHVGINAQMAAVELSLDRDWVRPRLAFFFASGDGNPRDGTATGFDSIVEAQTFAGGIFSYFNREGIRLTGTGVALTSPESFLPNLRSSKDEGQANYVNPGLLLWSAGVDFELTPKLKTVLNANYMRFHRTAPLELLLFQKPIQSSVGMDYSIGFVYRPPLSENMVITSGVAALTPFTALRQIYTSKTLFSGFTVVKLQF